MIVLSCSLPAGWKLTSLAELCEINPAKPYGFQREPDAPTAFIPMEAVDDKTGAVPAPQVRPYGAVARGYTYFEEGDIIFAKITPCMQNGKTAIVNGLRDGMGFGSTEFHVLRAKPGIDRRWIYHLLRSAEFRRKAEENFEGSAGQRRVPEHFLEAVCVPVVEDPAVQLQLIETLDSRIHQVNKIRPVAERQLEASENLHDGFVRSLFPFRDTRHTPEGWGVKPLRELRESIEYGLSKASTVNPIGPNFVRISDIQDADVNWDSVPFCECTEAEAASCRLETGDILFARTGATTGKSYLIENPPEAVFASYLIRVQCNRDRVLPEYLYAFFQSHIYWTAIGRDARGGAQAGFNATMLGDLLVPLPATKGDQARIAGEFRKHGLTAQRIKRAAQRQLEAVSALPAATLREYFKLGSGVDA